MELKLFGLLSFGFFFGSLMVWARNGMGELFLMMLCKLSERGLFAMFNCCDKKNARIFVLKVPCFNVEQIDNGC